jgi:tetratricopeptide (TPR) repeat protein
VRSCNASRRGWLLACALHAACFPALLWSHDGPEHEIEELTKRLKDEGEEASLYVDRAVEYQLLSKYAEAAKDLERAIELAPALVPAHRELGRVYFRLEKPKEALAVLGNGLAILSTPTEHATLLIARAEILLATNENEKALADVEAAIAKHSTSLEWYLLRSRLQARLGKCEERIRGLEAGIERTGSGLLDVELADALLDAGQHERAMAKIEQKLERARWRSSWLIRRARVHIPAGRTNEAIADLEEAVKELTRRIHSAAPAPTLLADRGRAHDLLGKQDLARSDYEAARSKGLNEDWLIERLKVLKKEAEEAAKR